jgi:hypothetical protein
MISSQALVANNTTLVILSKFCQVAFIAHYARIFFCPFGKDISSAALLVCSLLFTTPREQHGDLILHRSSQGFY